MINMIPAIIMSADAMRMTVRRRAGRTHLEGGGRRRCGALRGWYGHSRRATAPFDDDVEQRFGIYRAIRLRGDMMMADHERHGHELGIVTLRAGASTLHWDHVWMSAIERRVQGDERHAIAA